MRIQRAVQIAKREWENIRVSLKKCDDIGEFDSKEAIDSRLARVECLSLVRNLIEMDNKLPRHGYFTPEAAHVFANLASKAAERLGLIGKLAQSFGSGYTLVRTSYFDLKGVEEQKFVIQQLFFFKLFFPVGGDFNWDFNSPIVKTKLNLIFDKFATWQDNPRSYIQDVRDYKAQLEPLLRGLLLAFGFSVIDTTEEHEIEGWIEHRI